MLPDLSERLLGPQDVHFPCPRLTSVHGRITPHRHAPFPIPQPVSGPFIPNCTIAPTPCSLFSPFLFCSNSTTKDLNQQKKVRRLTIRETFEIAKWFSHQHLLGKPLNYIQSLTPKSLRPKHQDETK